jgi:hypothetical protein
MSESPQLHQSVVALVSLAAGIAANHPTMGPCQHTRLRSLGVPEHQIDQVIEIARHIRDEAGEKLDASFAEKLTSVEAPKTASGSCCAPIASGTSCC